MEYPSDMKSTPHYSELNQLRGWAIFLVVVGHSRLAFPVDFTQVWWGKLLHSYIYSFHMPLLFFVSGMFYGFSSPKTYRDLLCGKIKRLLIPYIVFSILAFAGKIFFNPLVNEKIGFGLGGILSAVLFRGGFFWFLYVLFLIFLISPLFVRCAEKTNKMLILLLLIVISLLWKFIIPSAYASLFCFSNVFYFMVFFNIGYTAIKYYARLKRFCSAHHISLLAISSILFLFYGDVEGNVRIFISPYIAPYVVPFFGIVLSFVCVIIQPSRGLNKILLFFDSYCLQIYLLEPFILIPARLLCINVFGICDPLVSLILIVSTKITVSLFISHLILKKYFITRLMSGISKGSLAN
ncbi:MAG: acyltransferase [Pseudomonadota bacterium]